MGRDLEDDIRADAEIMQKLQDDRYAQNVYAALCNMRWQPQEVWPILKEEWWTVSWRYAGEFVASLRDAEEDYLDWYCSGGIENNSYVQEGTVTEEIEADFARIGWRHSEWPN
jgi:hypothetical protein